MKAGSMILLVCSLIAFLSAALPALSEGRVPPEDKKIIADDASGFETSFRKYDPKFWDAASEEPGSVVTMTYTTSVYGEAIENFLNVYVPYGYDEKGTEKYDVIYFFHGTNEKPDSFIGDERAKNCLDNLIETGIAKPFLMVFPTYYYDYETRATDKELFCEELRQDIMPLVESAFRTYAPSADTEGFTASRDHRAMAGYSQGSGATWVALGHLLDTARWWLPMSFASDAKSVKASILAQGEWASDFFIYAASGGKRDLAYDGTIEMLKGMLDDDFFSLGTDLHANNTYVTISAEVHQTLIGRYYFYNAFCDGLLR